MTERLRASHGLQDPTNTNDCARERPHRAALESPPRRDRSPPARAARQVVAAAGAFDFAQSRGVLQSSYLQLRGATCEVGYIRDDTFRLFNSPPQWPSMVLDKI